MSKISYPIVKIAVFSLKHKRNKRKNHYFVLKQNAFKAKHKNGHIFMLFYNNKIMLKTKPINKKSISGFAAIRLQHFKMPIMAQSKF